MIETKERLLEGLNEEQILAVTTTEGPVLVVAGPGSGKTRVLTHRIAWLLEEGVPAHQILAVTFTNKAAREMRERIGRLVGEERAASLVMGTFHSFGMRVLRSNPLLVEEHLNLRQGFTIYDTGDQSELAKRAVLAIGLDPKTIQPRRMLGAISRAKAMMMTPDEVANAAQAYDDEIVARVYREYERGLRNANAVDFDDLLGLPLRLFDENERLLERYQDQFRYIMVDEYQDTNRVQYVLVSALAEKHRNLFVVGDPDQSIYGWRQADIKNILDFRETYPDVTQINLEINYRSTQHIVQAADRLIRDNTQRIERAIRTNNPEGEQIQVRELSDQSHEAKWIVDECRRLIGKGSARAADIAIMYRTTAQSRSLEEEFRNSEIAYRIIGGPRFYERKEVRNVLAVLRLLANPADRLSLERVIDNLPIGRGFGPKAMQAASDWAALHQRPLLDAFLIVSQSVNPLDVGTPAPAFSGPGLTGAQRIGNTFAKLQEKVGTVVLSALFDELIAETKFNESFNQELEEDLQRWANVQELRSDLERYDALPPEEQLGTYLEQVALVADVDSLPEDTSGAVTLITLHSAKGLEFPAVFIAGAEEGLLPINRAIENEIFDPTQMEEERRLFYVGVTRAQQLLYITYASSRMSYGRYQNGAPSRFLDALPAASVRATTRQERFGSSYSTGRLEGRRSGTLAGRVSRTWVSSSPTPVVPEPTDPLPDYEIGMKVFHAKFGEGQILELVDKTNDMEVVVDFARHGTKRLLASLARLEVLA